jgi:hypothetical protein
MYSFEYKNNKVVLSCSIQYVRIVRKYFPYSCEKYLKTKDSIVSRLKIIFQSENLFVKKRKNDDLDYLLNHIFSLYNTKKYCIKGKNLIFFTNTYDYT